MRFRIWTSLLGILAGFWAANAAVAASWMTEDHTGAAIPTAVIVGTDIEARIKLTCVGGEAIMAFSSTNASAQVDNAASIEVTGPAAVRSSIPGIIRQASPEMVAVAEGPLVTAFIAGLTKLSHDQKWSIDTSYSAKRRHPIATTGRPPELDVFIASCRKIVKFPSAIATQKPKHGALVAKPKACSALAKYACSAPCVWRPGQTVDGRHLRGRCSAQ